MSLRSVLAFAFLGFPLALASCKQTGEYNYTALSITEKLCTEVKSPYQCWTNGNRAQVLKANAILAFQHSSLQMEEFTNCLANEVERLPHSFFSSFNRSSSEMFATTECLTKEEVCDYNIHYFLPYACKIRSSCNPYLMEALYAFTYAEEMLLLETTHPLRCGNESRFDVEARMFERYAVMTPTNPIVSVNMCDFVERFDEDDSTTERPDAEIPQFDANTDQIVNRRLKRDVPVELNRMQRLI